MSDEIKNSPAQLMQFFNLGLIGSGKEVVSSEFRTFWQSLTDEEKEYYRTVDLTKL